MKGMRRNPRKRIRFMAVLLTPALILSLFLPFLPYTKAEAADGSRNFANLVIFVKHNNDGSDIFNAPKDSAVTNWHRIKQMYDEGTGTSSFNNSFTSYIGAVTEGKIRVRNYFPQETPNGNEVETFTLAQNQYGGDSLVTEVIQAVNQGKIHVDTASNQLDNISSGVIDNLTIILQGDTINGSDTAFHAYYAGAGTINGLRVSHYNVIPSGKLVSADGSSLHLKMEQGVLAHEFLHTLGLPDLYRNSNDGEPVGIWDIMASVGPYLQYPLSYLRARQGWISMGTITGSGTYTLTAVSETGGTKVFALRTPLSDSEFICLEYRKKNLDINQFEHKIPSSGLLMYRVDNKIRHLTNNGGDNYIYVYRPGVTDPELGADRRSDGFNLVHNAALGVTAGSSYGSTDLDADYTQNTLYYSDGRNSGIQISGLKLSPDESELTFTVTFADYSNAITWDNVGGSVSSQCIEDPSVCVDPTTGELYAAYAENAAGSYSGNDAWVCVKRWDGTAWRQVGNTIKQAHMARLAICDGVPYLSYWNQSNQPVYCKLEGSAWKQIAAHPVNSPVNMQFVVDGSDIYGAYGERASDSLVRWKIYDLKKGKLVDSSLTARDFSNPAMLKYKGCFYMVYADFAGGASQVKKYDPAGGSWSTVHTFPGQYTNLHQIVKQEEKIYAFAGEGYSAGIGTVAVFDGSRWTNYSVPSMKKFNLASMEAIGETIYLLYYDTESGKTKLLCGSGSSFQTLDDSLGTKVEFLAVCGYGNTLYVATRAQNTSNLVIRRKTVAGGSVTPPVPQEERLLTLVPPAGYTDSHIYIDGVEYTAAGSGNGYQLKLPDTSGRTAVMYSYDSRNVPVGMYVWKLSWDGQICRAVPMPGLRDLLSYHGFSIRVQSPAGIRFKSGIDAGLKRQLTAGSVDGCRLKEYGTLFITDENRKKYPFVKGGTKVGGGRAYWTENGKVHDMVYETVAGRNRFTSVLINLAPNMYAKDIAFRAYAVLECDGKELIVYGPPVCRSVYTVAKQIQTRGEFKPGSSGYKYVQEIVNSVEKK